MPTRLELKAGQISSVTITNQADVAVTIQMRAVSWTQDEETGKDTFLDETHDLIWYPKIFSLEAGAVQVVRVGLENAAEQSERSFRLFIRELPTATDESSGAAFAVRISIPIFIRPANSQQAKPEIMGLATRNNALFAQIHNPGGRYFMMHPLEVHGLLDGNEIFQTDVRGWYVLAGVKKSFDLGIDASQCKQVDTLRLVAVTESVRHEASFPVTAKMCEQLQGESEAPSNDS